MIGKTAAATRASGTQPDVLDSYDILILDAAYKQSLVSAQAWAGPGCEWPWPSATSNTIRRFPSLPSVPAIRPATWCSRATPPIRSRSPSRSWISSASTRRACSCPTVTAPSPRWRRTGNGSPPSAACSRWLRTRALEIANDKDRTLEVARRLGIDQPKTMRIDSLGDLPAALAEFTFPFVLKPNTSWSRRAGRRLVPTEVIDEPRPPT